MKTLQSNLSQEAKKSYNPGIFLSCEEVIPGSGVFSCKSFTGGDDPIVDIKEKTCTCKCFQFRGDCKHISRCKTVADVATSLTVERIKTLILKHNDVPEQVNILLAAIKVKKERNPAPSAVPAWPSMFQPVVDPSYGADFDYVQYAA